MMAVSSGDDFAPAAPFRVPVLVRVRRDLPASLDSRALSFQHFGMAETGPFCINAQFPGKTRCCLPNDGKRSPIGDCLAFLRPIYRRSRFFLRHNADAPSPQATGWPLLGSTGG